MNYIQLYPGIVTYDAFTVVNETNCYAFRTPLLLGVKSITLDFVMGHNNSEQINAHSNSFNLSYLATTKDNIIKSFMKKMLSKPLTYRLGLEFVP